MREFFQTVQPPGGVKFVAEHLGAGKGFRHYPCKTFEEMEARALRLVAEGKDAYYACASFEKEKYWDEKRKKYRSRTAKNAKSAKAFWLDLDVGEEKAKTQKGYKSQREAQEALREFCEAHGLPMPTIVSSGYGLHCYWALTEEVAKGDWVPTAKNIKKLTKSTPRLLADPMRTSDITSVLRPPGTRNFKWGGEGKLVEMWHWGKPIDFNQFSATVERAVEKLSTLANSANALPANLSPTQSEPPDMEELEEALRHIDPDIERDDWWVVIAPLADEYGEAVRELARRWSAGELHGKSSDKYDPDDFEDQFDDCLQRTGTEGDKATMGTVIWLARKGGWRGSLKKCPVWVAEMNDRYAWIEKQGEIYRLKFGDFINVHRFKQQHCNKFVTVEIKNKPEQKEIGEQWLRHPYRRQHKALVMRPKEGKVTEDNCLNTWGGFEVTPIRGDIRPFTELLKRLFPDKEVALYVLKWLAHQFQHPDVKMHVALVIWSRQQGVGKNLLFECVSEIIGARHATLIGQAELARDFNGWARDKIFVIGDEVSSEDRRQHADKLKGLVTSTTVQINEKHQPAYETENLMNFVFLSNHPTAIFLDDQDRRYFVVEIDADPLPADEALAFVKWRDNGGLEALLHRLQKSNISKFNPKAPAPYTAAKRQMIEDSRSGIEQWAASIMESGASRLIGREVATASELADLYVTDTQNTKPAPKAVTNAFKKEGARAHNSQVRLSSGRKVRPMALERPEHWKSQPGSEWAKEMEKSLKHHIC